MRAGCSLRRPSPARKQVVDKDPRLHKSDSRFRSEGLRDCILPYCSKPGKLEFELRNRGSKRILSIETVGIGALTVLKYSQTVTVHGVTAVDHGGIQITSHLGQLFSWTKFAALFRSRSASEKFQTPYTQWTVEIVAQIHRYRKTLWMLLTHIRSIFSS